MNIHPLFVHFPIALLVVYALMELTPRRFVRALSWWEDAKFFLLTLGILAVFPTLATGDMASDIVRGMVPPALVETHESLALITTLIFVLLWAPRVVRLFMRTGWGDMMVQKWWGSNALFAGIWRIKQRAAGFIMDTPLRPLLALAGLISITITGGLGAAIVYGPNVDPFVTVIYHLFF